MADDKQSLAPDGGDDGQRKEGRSAGQGDPPDDSRQQERGDGEHDKTAGEQPSWGNFYQNFHGNVYASQGVFGVGDASAAEPRSYGRLEETEIAKIAQTYAEPPCYAEAADALTAERVIVLTGEAGTGRRAAAIELLHRARSPEQPLVGLSPAVTVEQLAGRSFDEGTGYLVSDMFDVDIVPELADFYWGNVCRAVRRGKAHLVVTTGVGSRITTSSAVKRFPWQRPHAADALRAHLGAAMVEEEVVSRVAEKLGPGYQLGGIGDIARKLATAGPGHIDELAEELAVNDPTAVGAWLDKTDAEIPAVIEVAALAFVVGVPERIFEAELRDLKSRVAEFAPGIDTQSDKVRDEIDLRFRQLRKYRADHPLLAVRCVPIARGSGSLTIRHVDFSLPAYRKDVIVELWNRLPDDFWAGMRHWLHDLAADGNLDLITSAATGLALLALVAPDEVIDSYLDPWTAEDASWNEQMTAVYVIWRMSMLGQLAPLALQIAMHWAVQGSRTQRTAATYAFSGELGARFPVDAVKRLTHLADQGDVLARQAHALLFATLAEQGADAVAVLSEMRRRINLKQDKPSADRAMDAVVSLLSTRDPRSGRPSVALFLMANPGRTADLGLLWARSLRLRPWHERAISGLRATLGAIEHGQKNPDDLVRSLGAAIGRELPADERTSLASELLAPGGEDRRREDANRSQDGAKDGSARSRVSEFVLEIFLTACAHPFP